MRLKLRNKNTLFTRVAAILERARSNVVRTINTEIVQAYWLVGREIVLEEQQGAGRANYGASLIENLSMRLMNSLGKGYTSTNLKYMRIFYLTYPDLLRSRIRHAVRDELVSQRNNINPRLTWTHYRLLTKKESPHARLFYEAETVKNNWSSRELERQMNSMLFERWGKCNFT